MCVQSEFHNDHGALGLWGNLSLKEIAQKNLYSLLPCVLYSFIVYFPEKDKMELKDILHWTIFKIKSYFTKSVLHSQLFICLLIFPLFSLGYA